MFKEGTPESKQQSRKQAEPQKDNRVYLHVCARSAFFLLLFFTCSWSCLLFCLHVFCFFLSSSFLFTSYVFCY